MLAVVQKKKKKKLLKDCTEFTLAAAEATDAGGLSVPDNCSCAMFFL